MNSHLKPTALFSQDLGASWCGKERRTRRGPNPLRFQAMLPCTRFNQIRVAMGWCDQKEHFEAVWKAGLALA
jgi:hypothetical protein